MLRKILIGTGVVALLIFIASWLLFGVFIYPGEEPHKGQTALVNGHFITMAANKPDVIDDQALLIANDTISGFTAEADLPKGITRIDLEGGYAIPGLLDLHVHLGGVPLAEGYNMAAMILEFMRRLPNVREKFLTYGVTTVRSLGDAHPDGVEMRDGLASGSLEGPRLRVAGPMLTSPGGHPVSTIFKGNERVIESTTRQFEDPREARSVVDGLAEEGVDLIKVIYTAGRKDTLPRMKYEVMEAIIDQAHQRQRDVVVHVDSPADVEDAIRGGADGLEHMPRGVSDQLLQKIADQDIVVVPTLAVMQRSADEGREAAIPEAFSRWLEYDIPVALGTDAGNIPAGESVYAEMQAYLQAGMSPYEVLETATAAAARHAGLEEDLGTLEPGKYADIVVFDQHPLEQLQDLRCPELVFKEGALKIDR